MEKQGKMHNKEECSLEVEHRNHSKCFAWVAFFPIDLVSTFNDGKQGKMHNKEECLLEVEQRNHSKCFAWATQVLESVTMARSTALSMRVPIKVSDNLTKNDPELLLVFI